MSFGYLRIYSEPKEKSRLFLYLKEKQKIAGVKGAQLRLLEYSFTFVFTKIKLKNAKWILKSAATWK